MKKGIALGATLFFLTGLGSSFAWEKNPDGTPKTTKEKWMENKKNKIDQEAAAQKKKIDEVDPEKKDRAINQAEKDRKKQKIDDEAKMKKQQVEDDAKKLGGDHIYQKDKLLKTGK